MATDVSAPVKTYEEKVSGMISQTEGQLLDSIAMAAIEALSNDDDLATLIAALACKRANRAKFVIDLDEEEDPQYYEVVQATTRDVYAHIASSLPELAKLQAGA